MTGLQKNKEDTGSLTNVRKLVLKFAAMVLFAIPAVADPRYEADVNVDVTAATVTEAKKQAMAKAVRDGLNEVVLSISTAQSADEINKLNDNQLQHFVSGIMVLMEKSSDVRYIADLRISVNEDILKVDSFVNHQVDPELMKNIGDEFAEHFKGQGITKVATIESSGIAPALMTALALNVPMLILKKQPSKILNQDLYQTVVTSYTKGTSYELTLSKNFISENDHVLIIDDFLANGEAATGAIRLIRKAHATIAGVRILIEKSFQPGYEKLTEQGIDVYSLARIAKLGEGVIEFVKD